MSLVTSLVLTRLDYGSVTLNGITKRLMDRLRLQDWCITVVNTTAFHHFCATYTGCASLNASSFVWRSCIRCRNQTAPNYLARDLQWADTDDSRRRLRSATTQRLLVRRTRLRTIGDRTFGAIAPRVWNDLPADIISAPSLAIFKQRLKTHLFGQSFG